MLLVSKSCQILLYTLINTHIHILLYLTQTTKIIPTSVIVQIVLWVPKIRAFFLVIFVVGFVRVPFCQQVSCLTTIKKGPVHSFLRVYYPDPYRTFEFFVANFLDGFYNRTVILYDFILLNFLYFWSDKQLNILIASEDFRFFKLTLLLFIT